MIVKLLAHGSCTHRGRLGAYLWDVSAAWHERLVPRRTLVLMVLRDALRGHR